jgi:hypothetical protein
MSKQTAVEWLVEKIKSPIWQDMFIWHKEEVFTQAKAMEKEQIIDAVKYGHSDWGSAKNAEQYYNETYKGGDK